MKTGPLLIHTSEFPASSQTFVTRRFQWLLERGWDVRIVCRGSDESLWTTEPQLVALGGRKRTLVFKKESSLRSAIGRSKPQIVHFEFGHHARRLIDAVPSSARVLVSFQGSDIAIHGLERDPGFYGLLWDRIDAAHFGSADLRALATARGMPDTMVAEVIHPLIDLDTFSSSPRAPSMRVGTEARPLRVLTVGRTHWKKGHQYLLRSMYLLRRRGVESHLRIVGDGPSMSSLNVEVDVHGLRDRVSFLGALPPAAVAEQLCWSDVAVVASVSEGFSCSALEAQAMGVPVVVSDAEGLAENVVDGETGWVVPRRNVRAMADRLLELARDPEMRDRLGRAGASRARSHLSPDLQFERFVGLYERLAATS